MTQDLEQVADPFDRMTPNSVFNLVTPAVQAAILEAYKSCPDIFGLDEKTLYMNLRDSRKLPSSTDNRIRLAFWMEYDRAASDLRPMNMTNVFRGICSQQFFHGRYLSSASKVAWMLTIPASYDMLMEEGVSFGVNLLRSYLDLDATGGSSGRPDIRLMELQMKIVMMLDMRLKGGTVQKVQTLNVHTTSKQLQNMAVENTMESMTARLEQLEKLERQALNLPHESPNRPEPIEVENS